MSFNPKTDVPKLKRKVILVTGANSGLGKAAITEFCRHHLAEVWLAARSLAKAQAADDEIKWEIPNAPIMLLNLDLSSFNSVNSTAKAFTSDRLDILMLNAGVMAVPPAQTSESYEVQFGTNHMDHTLLTKLLLPRYGQSKLANILWAKQLASPSFTVSSVHPGVVKTDLLSGARNAPPVFRAIFWAAHVLGFKSTVETGVKNQLWAAVSKDVKSGEYYEPVGAGGKASLHGTDDKLAIEI
ncbi:hypothetical protein PENCOP_c005G03530 [Penicillium coprophilum]|uniref:NAD(P)-binding protein n=1 Tax=Penicillium coprophilum TaxID=36646 RepID=A0A1V6UR99_9EURO|nr:hypothetical protein PENCOP_c005G03530 [Penicillium coprophilum]